MRRSWTPEERERACEEILAWVASGKSLRSICDKREPGIPPHPTFILWCNNDPELASRYDRALMTRADVLAEEILEIADDARNDWMEKQGDQPGYELNGEHVQRSKLRVDARKWVAASMHPKKYGANASVNLSGAIKVEGIQMTFVDAAEAQDG